MLAMRSWHWLFGLRFITLIETSVLSLRMEFNVGVGVTTDTGRLCTFIFRLCQFALCQFNCLYGRASVSSDF